MGIQQICATNRPGGEPSGPTHEHAVAALGELVGGLEAAARTTRGVSLTRGRAKRSALYRQLVAILLRLMLVGCAEERGLWPLGPPRGQGSRPLRALRLELERARQGHGTPLAGRHRAWPRVLRLLRQAERELSDRAHSWLEDFPSPLLSDASVLRVLELLGIGRAKQALASEPDVERLGALYEGLQGVELRLADAGAARGGARQLTLGPSEERRRTGSHYTPRSLTAPIVAAALAPHLARLGAEAEPAQILALRVCDPAMGSGAFLLEACRQLADALAGAWQRRRGRSGPARPGATTLRARRLVARSCLYGVDRNERAAELGRLSLWLLTAARESPGRYLADRLRCGDSLVGQPCPVRPRSWPAERPFHWPSELPEVFGRGEPGFDCVVGNPPFLGGKRLRTVHGDAYRDWLGALHPGANSNADLVAHFFRRSFELLRPGGTLGLLATNTIAQGDTRAAGLGWIRAHGGCIYRATRRLRWPGDAAVVVSVVHVLKGEAPRAVVLDGAPVERITAYLCAAGGDDEPRPLRGNADRAFIGCFVRGMGFTFDDSSERASPVALLRRILAARPESREVIFPYLGGAEVLSSPTHAAHRYVVNFGPRELGEVRQRWPELLRLVETKVRPFREALGSTDADLAHRRRWWRFANDRPELCRAIGRRSRVAVIPRLSRHLCVTWLPSRMVFSDQLVVVPAATDADLAVLQSRVHELWARFFASTFGDGLRYNPSDCFDTFPFPPATGAKANLAASGRRCVELRARIMRASGQGLTRTYNRFHDPADRSPAMAELRAAQAAMDQAVLAAYGWTELAPAVEFRTQLDDTTRLAWPADVRDELLGRLLELNERQAAGGG